jgi:type II secretory pathway pseudopilin PulG
MTSRARRAFRGVPDLLALLGSAGSVVFGVLAGEGGPEHVRYLVLAGVCAAVPVTVTIVTKYIGRRKLRAEVQAREQALQNQRQAEEQAASVQIEAEARLIFALRSWLSPILSYLAKIAAAPSDEKIAEAVGRLTQAVVSAAAERRDSRGTRRSVFFRLTGEQMECVSYAGYEGQQDSARMVFADSSSDPLGHYMFQLLSDRKAVLIPNVDDPALPVRFPAPRSYETLIAAAVSAGETPYGVLVLDASEAESLDNPDLETVKTLASLLGICLALVAPDGTRSGGSRSAG